MPYATPNHGSPVSVWLGPTNTGKTHRAVERLLEHDTGMIGLPLRLLAREVYDRVRARVGEGDVALVTGEEKRVPRRPRYWICTVEAMPRDVEVDFLAVDEIQLAAHPTRGHIFTDRLLNARGRRETCFMGSDTVKRLVARLLPAARFSSRPRLSRLTWRGRSSLAALPPRSAVVGFSMAEVYAIAEKLRARHGGAAVVLGALSPRTRNAQVAMYQAGEVDYLVATDAIGMGLNLDVDHVAFASLVKFDGRQTRALATAELAQIAGRAGRHLNAGSFGCLKSAGDLPEEQARCIEEHRFPEVRQLMWRNSDLEFANLEGLLLSLQHPPNRACLKMLGDADDARALFELAKWDEVRRRANTEEVTRLLWDVCQIPDFSQLLFDQHVRLLSDLFLQLTGTRAALDEAWIAEQVGRIDDVRGDIDDLMSRIAFIRTWTYISNHQRWLPDAEGWQQRTRAVEDRLSDALHDALISRFVERARPGHATPRRRVRRRKVDSQRDEPGASPFAALLAMRQRLVDPDSTVSSPDWFERALSAPAAAFRWDHGGWVGFDGVRLARLAAGNHLLRPELRLELQRELSGIAASGSTDTSSGEELSGTARVRLERRLKGWLRDELSQLFAELDAAVADDGGLRGIAYHLRQGLGTVDKREVEALLRDLSHEQRRALARAGVHIGHAFVYQPKLLRKQAFRLRAALVCAADPSLSSALAELPRRVTLAPQLAVGRSALSTQRAVSWSKLGYPVFDGLAIRCDAVEACWSRLADQQPGELSVALRRELAAVLGCPASRVQRVLEAMGWSAPATRRPKTRRRRRRKPRGRGNDAAATPRAEDAEPR